MVSPQGPASFDDADLVIQAVLEGVGIGTVTEDTLPGLIAEGRLIQVLRVCPHSPDISFTALAVGINLPPWPRRLTPFDCRSNERELFRELKQMDELIRVLSEPLIDRPWIRLGNPKFPIRLLK